MRHRGSGHLVTPNILTAHVWWQRRLDRPSLRLARTGSQQKSDEQVVHENKKQSNDYKTNSDSK
jgi:hypothetical protein